MDDVEMSETTRTSYLTPHTSHPTPHTPHLTPHLGRTVQAKKSQKVVHFAAAGAAAQSESALMIHGITDVQSDRHSVAHEVGPKSPVVRFTRRRIIRGIGYETLRQVISGVCECASLTTNL